MKKVTLVVSDYLKANKIFDSTLHRDDIFDRFVKLKSGFERYGYNLSTQDINLIDEAEYVLYASNMPDRIPTGKDVDKSYLILSESHFIRPDNFDFEKHEHFRKIFTWRDDLIDGDKYVKLNYAHRFPDRIDKDLSRKTGLCTLIAGNKKPPFIKENDLYSEREKAIRWFESNHLDDFDLYGVGWDRYRFGGPRAIRALNRLPAFCKLFLYLSKQGFPSYQGPVENKKSVMAKYKFSICYENARDIPGYITEKIFDSFFASCVPIYWGAPNVSDHIDENCFIDARNFSSYEALYSFVSEMDSCQYLSYLNNIERYLLSDAAVQFKSEGFVATIVDAILGENYDYK